MGRIGEFVQRRARILIFMCAPVYILFAWGLCGAQVLAIQDYRTGRDLFSSLIKEGSFTYQFRHSVFGDDVRQVYSIAPGKRFLLRKVMSSPRVLSLPYPGFELCIPLEKSSKKVIALPLRRFQDELILVVGSDNLFLLNGKAIRLNEIAPEGTILRTYLKGD